MDAVNDSEWQAHSDAWIKMQEQSRRRKEREQREKTLHPEWAQLNAPDEYSPLPPAIHVPGY